MLLSIKDLKSGISAHPPSGPFVFSREVSPGWWEKVVVSPIQEVLEQNLSLERYGSLRRIYFLAIVRAPEQIWDQQLLYEVDEQELHIQLGINPELDGPEPSQEELCALIARYFLASVNRLNELPVPNFAGGVFFQDVKTLFQQQAWLGAPLPALDWPVIPQVWASSFHSGLAKDQPAQIFVRKITRPEWYEALDSSSFAAQLNEGFERYALGPGVRELYLSLLADAVPPTPQEALAVHFGPERELHLSLPLGPPPYEPAALVQALREGLQTAACEVDGWDPSP